MGTAREPTESVGSAEEDMRRGLIPCRRWAKGSTFGIGVHPCGGCFGCATVGATNMPICRAAVLREAMARGDRRIFAGVNAGCRRTRPCIWWAWGRFGARRLTRP